MSKLNSHGIETWFKAYQEHRKARFDKIQRTIEAHLAQNGLVRESGFGTVWGAYDKQHTFLVDVATPAYIAGHLRNRAEGFGFRLALL